MKEKRDFDEYWKDLTSVLSTKQTIRNWTVKNGYIGEDFTVMYVSAPHTKELGYIEVTIPASDKKQRVRRHSFLKVHPYWEGYKSGKVLRSFLSHKKKNPNATRHSKYIISMLHQFENLMYK